MSSEYYKEYKKNMMKIDGLNKVRNHVPIHINESLKHLQTKIMVCRYLRVCNIDFICEAKFKTQDGRADIYLPQLDKVIEILCSEKMVEAKRKESKYPVKSILFFTVEDSLDKVTEWLHE